MMAEPLAAALHGVAKHYHGFTLGPLNLEIPAGSIVGLIGENGAGGLVFIGAAGIQPQCHDLGARQGVHIGAVCQHFGEDAAVLAVGLPRFCGVIQAHFAGIAVKLHVVAHGTHHAAGYILQNHLRVAACGNQLALGCAVLPRLPPGQLGQLPAFNGDRGFSQGAFCLGGAVPRKGHRTLHQPEHQRRAPAQHRQGKAMGKQSVQAAFPCHLFHWAASLLICIVTGSYPASVTR